MKLSKTWQRDDRYSALFAGAMWVLIVLMTVPEGFDYGYLATSRVPSSGGVVSRTLWLALLALSATVILWRASLTWLQARTTNIFFLLFLVLAVASVVWSIDPPLTARRLVRLGTIVLACVAFVTIAWHTRRFQNVVRPVMTLVLAGSLLMGIVLPTFAIHHETSAELVGAWHGLANHKNGLGALSCMGLILWLHAGLTRETSVVRAVAGCALATSTLILSRSSTSLLAAVFVVALLLILLRTPHGMRPYQPYLITGLLALLMVYALVLLNMIPGMATLLAPIAALTDKDVTLSGRTEIWNILIEHIGERPFFGAGYGAYWTPAPTIGSDSFEFVTRMHGFYPGSAHNGYLEVVNDLGWIGFACLMGYIVTYVYQSLRLLKIDRNQSALYLALFFQQVVSNQSESHWFSALSIDFVIITLATLALARSLLEHRLLTTFGDPNAEPDVGPSGLGALLVHASRPLPERGGTAHP